MGGAGGGCLRDAVGGALGATAAAAAPRLSARRHARRRRLPVRGAVGRRRLLQQPRDAGRRRPRDGARRTLALLHVAAVEELQGADGGVLHGGVAQGVGRGVGGPHRLTRPRGRVQRT